MELLFVSNINKDTELLFISNIKINYHSH
jgi:hypothetical protein